MNLEIGRVEYREVERRLAAKERVADDLGGGFQEISDDHVGREGNTSGGALVGTGLGCSLQPLLELVVDLVGRDVDGLRLLPLAAESDNRSREQRADTGTGVKDAHRLSIGIDQRGHEPGDGHDGEELAELCLPHGLDLLSGLDTEALDGVHRWLHCLFAVRGHPSATLRATKRLCGHAPIVPSISLTSSSA